MSANSHILLQALGQRNAERHEFMVITREQQLRCEDWRTTLLDADVGLGRAVSSAETHIRYTPNKHRASGAECHEFMCITRGSN